MSTRKTSAEVVQEISALEALKFTGSFARKMEKMRDVQVDVLRVGIDDTCEEWEELSDEEKDASFEAANWKSGASTTKPSSGYDGFTE